MIVNYKENGWEVVTQRAHGLVAAQLAFQWKAKDRPERWVETLLAIAEHDDAENELDGENLLTEAGGPLNFSMKTFELSHCRKLSSLTLTKSRYIALLTSLHIEFLYGKEKKDNAEARAFLQEQGRLQNNWLKELNMKKEQALRVYDLLEWCDAFSLLICKQEMQPEKRRTEISTGPDKKMYHLVQLSENTLSVDPWPFEATSFSVNHDYRLIEQIQFNSSAQFRAAFLAADTKEKRWQLKKGNDRRTKTKKV
jgi:hypothetical protein